jgi:hypothetical protein
VDSGTQLTVESGGARWQLAAAQTGARQNQPPGLSKVPFYSRFGPTGAAHRGELTSDGRVRRRGSGSTSQQWLDPPEL